MAKYKDKKYIIAKLENKKHAEFKAICAKHNITMQKCLIDLVNKFIQEQTTQHIEPLIIYRGTTDDKM